MSESTVYHPHNEGPARAQFRAGSADRIIRGETRSFELVSRGDFVCGELLLPETIAPRPAPLILLTLADGCASDVVAAEWAAAWVGSGFAIAAIDLPLHGRRSSPKLSERLAEGVSQLLAGQSLHADTHALVEEFARQSTSDLIRTAEALSELPEIDAQRVGLMGVGFGAVASAYALAHAPRFSAAVLSIGSSRIEDPGLDPAIQIAARRQEAPFATLVQSLTSEGDAPDESVAKQLFQAAPEPKASEKYAVDLASNSVGGLPSGAAETARDFLAKHLRL